MFEHRNILCGNTTQGPLAKNAHRRHKQLSAQVNKIKLKSEYILYHLNVLVQNMHRKLNSILYIFKDWFDIERNELADGTELATISVHVTVDFVPLSFTFYVKPRL